MALITINESKNLLIIKNYRIPLITPDNFETIYVQLNVLASVLGYESLHKANKVVKNLITKYKDLKDKYPNITVLTTKNIDQVYFINEIGLYKLLITSRKSFAQELFLKIFKIIRLLRLGNSKNWRIIKSN